ncbi:MAG: hypothetical protein KGI29_04630 [Pseudomonadota bacterium]|nr:hypothetical protein [Pseudomonadota bacterium]MDE3037082.1 hypothetical protein [Pseudomonadota bacterium]
MADARPINHDAASTGLEVGTKALGWGAALAVLTALVPPIAIGAATFFGTAALWTAATGFWASAGVIAGGIAGAALTVYSGMASFAAAGTAAAGGALFGVLKGASKVNQEVASYRQHSEALAHTREHAIGKQVNDAGIASLQEGYMLGAAEGEQRGIQKGAAMVIRQLQAQEQQMAQQAQAAEGFAAKEDKKRAGQTATGQQVG